MADDQTPGGVADEQPGRLPAATTNSELGASSGTEAAAAEVAAAARSAGPPSERTGTGENAAGAPSDRKARDIRNAAEHKSGSRDPKVFVLLRELSEVHLLLDNLSANPGTTLSSVGPGNDPTGPKLPDNWIQQVCEISWPPDGSNEEKADDAALLIQAKDQLNRLSHPASGSTIAFTLLVTQEDTQKRRAARDEGTRYLPTRNSLAQTAYPDLIGKAIKFRRYMSWMCAGLLAALLFTCALSWYVAYGNEALAELRTSRASLAEAETQLVAAAAQEATERSESQPAATDAASGAAPPGPDTATGSRAASPASQSIAQYCATVEPLSPQGQQCAARERALESLVRTEERLASWTCWRVVRDCRGETLDVPFTEDVPSHAAALATILGSAVLPFLYGLLGAGAAIIRSLSRKIRASLLSPRDLHLSFQQLALGAVVGACIGLFVAAPDANATGESLLGPVTLSASAISFVAGFGVEAVFQALEALITRIFNVTQAPMGNRGDGLPTN